MKLLNGAKGAHTYVLCKDAIVMEKIVTFPPIDKFVNDMTNTCCTPKDCQFGIDVYESFNRKNL